MATNSIFLSPYVDELDRETPSLNPNHKTRQNYIKTTLNLIFIVTRKSSNNLFF
jgi:hypothetical protein